MFRDHFFIFSEGDLIHGVLFMFCFDNTSHEVRTLYRKNKKRPREGNKKRKEKKKRGEKGCSSVFRKKGNLLIKEKEIDRERKMMIV